MKEGIYQENLLILPDHSGLTLVAKGDVVIEARGPGGAGRGPAIQVIAENVLCAQAQRRCVGGREVGGRATAAVP